MEIISVHNQNVLLVKERTFFSLFLRKYLIFKTKEECL